MTGIDWAALSVLASSLAGLAIHAEVKVRRHFRDLPVTDTDELAVALWRQPLDATASAQVVGHFTLVEAASKMDTNVDALQAALEQTGWAEKGRLHAERV